MQNADVQQLIQALSNAGWYTEEISAEPLIINVHDDAARDDDSYRFTITATVTE